MLFVLVLVFAIIVILLPFSNLINLYWYIMSALLVFIANAVSGHFVEMEQLIESGITIFNDVEFLKRIAVNMIMQCTMASLVAYLLNLGNRTKLVLFVYVAPILARIADVPASELPRIHGASATFAFLLSVLYLFNLVPAVLDLGRSGIQRASVAIQLYGWIPFLVSVWFNMLLPLQFLVFWLSMCSLQFWRYATVAGHPIWREGWPMMLLAAAAECCGTPVSFVGLCVVVSYASCALLALAKLYLYGGCSVGLATNEMHRGIAEGLTMFLLGIQTGLMDLRPSERAFLLSVVLFIVLASLMQSLFEIADPVLLTLAVSQSKSAGKHIRTIVLCTFLWICPLYMTRLICQFFDVDFWLLVVISTCILTSLQVIGSLVIYALLMYDAVRQTPWESLDDVIYYARCLVRVLEFFVALFVVGYGVERSVLGNWNWLNSSILVVHCYFNVWRRLQDGWVSYLQRRDAIKKLESMPLATKAQLHELDDVCTICFQEMQTSARMTPCCHFFHGSCLKKWLFLQDYCPICHDKILLPASGNDVEKSSDAAAAAEGSDVIGSEQANRRGSEDPSGVNSR